MTIELELCPFCEGDANLHETDWCEPPEWNAYCTNCLAHTMGSTDKQQAVKNWNRRPMTKDWKYWLGWVRDLIYGITICVVFLYAMDHFFSLGS